MRKGIKITLIVIIILIVLFIGSQYICAKGVEYFVYDSGWRNYLSCASDEDCKVTSFCSCINSKGATKYNILTSLCIIRPQYKCVSMGQECSCVNDICKFEDHNNFG